MRATQIRKARLEQLKAQAGAGGGSGGGGGGSQQKQAEQRQYVIPSFASPSFSFAQTLADFKDT